MSIKKPLKLDFITGKSQEFTSGDNLDLSFIGISTGILITSNALQASLSVGVLGGQSVIGGTGSSNNLTLSSTTNTTKGKIYLGTSQTAFFDEALNYIKIITNGIGVSQSGTTGIYLQNASGATSILNQDSPAIVFEGQGWKTNATAGSQEVSIRQYATPTNSAISPNVALTFDYNQNGGIFNTFLSLGIGNISLTNPSTLIVSSLANGLEINSGAGPLYLSNNVGAHVQCLTSNRTILPQTQVSVSNLLTIGGTTIVASALLNFVTTTKGFLPPVLTTTQKNAIASPAEGLVVYDSTLHKLCVRTVSAWETITSV